MTDSGNRLTASFSGEDISAHTENYTYDLNDYLYVFYATNKEYVDYTKIPLDRIAIKIKFFIKKGIEQVLIPFYPHNYYIKTAHFRKTADR